MKKILLLFMFLIGKLGSYAQTIKYSEPQDFNVAKDLFEIGGWVDDRLMIFYTQKNESFIDLYDQNMVRKAIVSLSFMPEKPKQIKLVPMDDKIMLLYSAMTGSKEFYYAALLDKQGKLIGKPKNLDEQQQNFLGYTKIRYQFVVSEHNQKMALFGYQIKDNKLQYHINIVDNDLNISSSSSGKVDCKNAMEVEQALIKDDGTLVLNINDLNSSHNQSIGEAAIYTIKPVAKNKSEAQVFPFELQGKFLSGLYIKDDLAKANNLYFAAFYMSRSNGIIEGSYLGNVAIDGSTNGLTNGAATPFDVSLLESYKGKDQKLLNDYRIKDIIVKNDGGVILAAEAFYSFTRTTSNGMYNGYSSMGFGGMGMNNSSYTEYNYGNILILDFKPNYETNWFNMINKNQRTTDDYGTYSSYNMLNSGAQLVFTYNNIQRNGIKLQVAALDMEGSLTEKDIAATMKSNGLWLPKLSVQTDNKELVIPVVKSNKKMSFAKLSY
ncbi:hypothetical protein [Taibaiella sp. KBW10]|uniref:hypothetical protein n=1 Tax=Taibaiella sp. KBW10 TaxID=2153357 RepID=UPI000F5B7DD8|nr:hypothetical protein [Taibaiella sp. KBW10]